MSPAERPRRLLSSTALYATGDFLTTALSGFIFIPLYLHYMTPADYGLYGTVLVMINVVGVLMSLGFSSAFARYFFIYRQSGREYAYLGTIWLFQLLVALALAVVVLLWGEPLWRAITPDIPFRPYVWFVAVGGFLSFSSYVYPLWLRVKERPVAFVALDVGGSVFYLVLLVLLLILFREGARGVLAATVGSTALLALLALLLLGRKARWSLDLSLVRPSLAFGGWMVFGAFGYFVLNKSQMFFLQRYSDLASVGVYNLGQQIGGMLALIAVSFGKAWQPVVYSSRTDDEAAASIARISKSFVAGMLYLMLGIALLSNEILHVLAKPGFYGAGVIIRLVTVASFIYVLGTLNDAVLLYQKRALLDQLPMLVAMGLNVALNIVLIPPFQMVGAAIAMLISFAVKTLVGFFLAQWHLRVAYPWKALCKMTGIAAIMLAGEWLLVPEGVGWLATTVRVGLLVLFVPVLLLTGAFTKAEEKLIWSSVDQALRRVGLRRARKEQV